MTGILERIEAQNAQILALLSAGAGAAAPAAAAPLAAPVAAPAPAAPLAAPAAPLAAPGGLGGLGAPAAAAPTVTADMITTLIQPYLGDAAWTQILRAEMEAIGVAQLPDVTEAQYAELYGRFQAAIQRNTAGAAAPAAAAPLV